MPELTDLVNMHGEVVERAVLREHADQHEGAYMQFVDGFFEDIKLALQG